MQGKRSKKNPLTKSALERIQPFYAALRGFKFRFEQVYRKSLILNFKRKEALGTNLNNIYPNIQVRFDCKFQQKSRCIITFKTEHTDEREHC